MGHWAFKFIVEQLRLILQNLGPNYFIGVINQASGRWRAALDAEDDWGDDVLRALLDALDSAVLSGDQVNLQLALDQFLQYAYAEAQRLGELGVMALKVCIDDLLDPLENAAADREDTWGEAAQMLIDVVRKYLAIADDIGGDED